MSQFTIKKIIPPQEPEKSKFRIHSLEPAENLTRQSGLVRETYSLNGVFGHEVVVFRKKAGHLEYYRILPPGDRLSRIKMLFKEITSYLVDISPRRMNFSQRFIGENYTAGIEFGFNIEYSVDNSVRLCEHLQSDPLGKIRDKTTWYFKERFSPQDSTKPASVLHSLRQILLNDIQVFAQSFGIAISMIDIRPRLVEDIVKQRQQEAERKTKFLEIEMEEAIRSSRLQTEKEMTIQRDAHEAKMQDAKNDLDMQKLREEAKREKIKMDAELEIELEKKRLEYERLKKDIELIAFAKEGMLNAGIKALEKLVVDIDSASDLPEKVDQFTKAISKLRALFTPTRPLIDAGAESDRTSQGVSSSNMLVLFSCGHLHASEFSYCPISGKTIYAVNSAQFMKSPDKLSPDSQLQEKTDEDVWFTLYHPKDIKTECWYTMLVYTHLLSKAKDVELNSKKFTGELNYDPREIRSKSAARLKRDTKIRIVPEAQGVEFNPPEQSFLWVEDVHCAYFRFRACSDLINQPCFGEITVYVDPLQIANIRFSMFIINPSIVSDDKFDITTMKTQSRMYRQLFASYSSLDINIVKACIAAFKAIGDEVYIDYETLRSGENWKDKLLRCIDTADIFQLFWSENAKRSENVEKEWRYALKRAQDDANNNKRSNAFIRPVYWERPLPEVPSELSHIHFKFLPELDQR